MLLVRTQRTARGGGDDRGALRVAVLADRQPGVPDGLLGGGQSQDEIAVDPGVDRRPEHLGRVDVRGLGDHFDVRGPGQFGSGPPQTGGSGAQRVEGLAQVPAQGADHSDARDDRCGACSRAHTVPASPPVSAAARAVRSL